MLLRKISESPQLSQRELSTHLGLSLGKVNFLIKALMKKGLLKAHNFKNAKNKIAYLYYLTPRGAEEKAKITYRFLMRKVSEYEKLKIEIRQLQKEIDLQKISSAFHEKV
jgi:EPS-associated MarR family transcriptional regulator